MRLARAFVWSLREGDPYAVMAVIGAVLAVVCGISLIFS